MSLNIRNVSRTLLSLALALTGLWLLAVPDYSARGLIAGGLLLWASLRIR
jgi:hypothetical protein